MPACSQCSVEVPETQAWYLTGGATACKACYQAALAKEAAERARLADAPGGPDSPTRMMVKGGAVFGLGVAWIAAGLTLADRLYFYPFFLLLPGFAIFARGLHLRRGR